MTPEQRARFTELLPRLVDTVLADADPANWPGAGRSLAQMTRDERGNRVWAAKNAVAGLSLLEDMYRLIGPQEGGSEPLTEPGVVDRAELEARVREAERQAQEVVQRISQRGHS